MTSGSELVSDIIFTKYLKLKHHDQLVIVHKQLIEAIGKKFMDLGGFRYTRDIGYLFYNRLYNLRIKYWTPPIIDSSGERIKDGVMDWIGCIKEYHDKLEHYNHLYKKYDLIKKYHYIDEDIDED
jgi:hypothetical protein